MGKWQEKLDIIDGLIEDGLYNQAVRDARAALEELLKQVYDETVPKLAPAEQQKVSTEASNVGTGKAVADFTLGQLIGLYSQTKFATLAGNIRGKKLEYLATAPLNRLNDLGNKVVHKKYDADEEDAKYFASQLGVLCKELGLLEDKRKKKEGDLPSGMKLKPWTEVVTLHPDVESGELTESVFAIDLGAVEADDPAVPAVYGDAREFFRSTYLTVELKKLLSEVLASLAGEKGHNRVIKLRTPFGGGKSHALVTLLHASRSRRELDRLPEAEGIADPGEVAVAVFDGEKFDVREGKTLPDGRTIRTMWGWLGYQLGEEAFKTVEGHDRDMVSPSGDVVKEMLAGGPKLLLLDEVLKYIARAQAVEVKDSNLGHQTKDFFQTLTVEVAGGNKDVLVYSLPQSSREALGDEVLLQELDHLAARVDQAREPVTGDDILPVLQRRLLSGKPLEEVVEQVAEVYSKAVGKLIKATAEAAVDKKNADKKAYELRRRISEAYPFHPALIDLMKERWCSVDAFQRTRGALKFLATCLHALKKEGDAGPLLGPGDIPLRSIDVRNQMLEGLGVGNDYDPVVTHDIEGTNARAKVIDKRMGAETPALASVRPGTRLATAVLAYSFGGLKRVETASEEKIPSGVTETELLSACVGPEIDRMTAVTVLGDLRTRCLYLHHDGVNYCFKTEPNVTKLIEDAEQEVSRDPEAVKDHIRGLLQNALAGKGGAAVLWPYKSQDIPDTTPLFCVGYLTLEMADERDSKQEQHAVDIFSNYGDKPRRYRNAVALAVPDKKKAEDLRRAARYLMAIGIVDARKSQHPLSKGQEEQLRERRDNEKASAESALRELYPTVLLPIVKDGGLGIEKLEVGGRPLQATGLHERTMELLTAVGAPKIFSSLAALKVLEKMKLGERPSKGEPAKQGARLEDIRDAFFSIIEPPRLTSDKAIKQAVAEGVTNELFGYYSGAVPNLGEDGKFQVNRDRVVFGKSIQPEEVDLDSGFIMMPAVIPEVKELEPPPPPPPPPPPGERENVFIKKFRATRGQIFKTFNALANLADKSDDGKITVYVEGHSEEGYERTWLRNAVEEPIDEADVEVVD